MTYMSAVLVVSAVSEYTHNCICDDMYDMYDRLIRTVPAIAEYIHGATYTGVLSIHQP